MGIEWKKTAIVKDGGIVEVVLPELQRGDEVEVVVRANGRPSSGPKRPGFASARGLVSMSEDFDAPLDDFKDYA
jgi:hypothetical protein